MANDDNGAFAEDLERKYHTLASFGDDNSARYENEGKVIGAGL